MLTTEQRHTSFELISTDMYYISARELMCSINSVKIDDIERTSVKIRPIEFESAELNNGRLSAAGMFTGGREFIEKRKNIAKEELNTFFTEFRGLIFGYPFYHLVVNLLDDKETLICDAIRIKGGYKNKFPYYGYSKFTVDFLTFCSNGDIKTIKNYAVKDVGKRFSIKKEEKTGQIISRFPDFPYPNTYLNPSDLVDFINGVRASYSGTPSYPWTEIKGTIKTDSTFNKLNIAISLKTKEIMFYHRENLFEKTYEIISHSSMDPGNDECTESTDRFIWATMLFNEQTLIEIIKDLSQWEKVRSINNNYVGFTNVVSKSEFEEITGIHLFESIIHTSSRY